MALADAEVAVVRAAIDRAWQQLEGPGPRPGVEVSIPLLEMVAVARPEGDSLWLAVVLEAIRAFAGIPAQQRVLATGRDSSELGAWNAKYDCAERTRGALGHVGLLWTSRSAPAPLTEKPEQFRARSVEDACDRVFGYTPWHPHASDVRRIIVDASDRPAAIVRANVSRFNFDGAEPRVIDV